MDALTGKERILRAVHDTAVELGYLVYDASIIFRGENSRVIVKIDHQSGISHRDCEQYSRRLAMLLDDMKVLPNYSLEVSSPGLDRKVRTPEEFIRFTGAPVKIVYMDDEVKKTIKGEIGTVTAVGVSISTENGEIAIAFSKVVSANLAY